MSGAHNILHRAAGTRQPLDLYVNLAGVGGLVGFLICFALANNEGPKLSSCTPKFELPTSRSNEPLSEPYDIDMHVSVERRDVHLRVNLMEPSFVIGHPRRIPAGDVYLEGELMEVGIKEDDPKDVPIAGLLEGFKRLDKRLASSPDGGASTGRSGRRVTIFSDKEAPFGVILRVMHTCRQAGFDRMEFRLQKEWPH